MQLDSSYLSSSSDETSRIISSPATENREDAAATTTTTTSPRPLTRSPLRVAPRRQTMSPTLTKALASHHTAENTRRRMSLGPGAVLPQRTGAVHQNVQKQAETTIIMQQEDSSDTEMMELPSFDESLDDTNNTTGSSAPVAPVVHRRRQSFAAPPVGLPKTKEQTARRQTLGPVLPPRPMMPTTTTAVAATTTTTAAAATETLAMDTTEEQENEPSGSAVLEAHNEKQASVFANNIASATSTRKQRQSVGPGVLSQPPNPIASAEANRRMSLGPGVPTNATTTTAPVLDTPAASSQASSSSSRAAASTTSTSLRSRRKMSMTPSRLQLRADEAKQRRMAKQQLESSLEEDADAAKADDTMDETTNEPTTSDPLEESMEEVANNNNKSVESIYEKSPNNESETNDDKEGETKGDDDNGLNETASVRSLQRLFDTMSPPVQQPVDTSATTTSVSTHQLNDGKSPRPNIPEEIAVFAQDMSTLDASATSPFKIGIIRQSKVLSSMKKNTPSVPTVSANNNTSGERRQQTLDWLSQQHEQLKQGQLSSANQSEAAVTTTLFADTTTDLFVTHEHTETLLLSPILPKKSSSSTSSKTGSTSSKGKRKQSIESTKSTSSSKSRRSPTASVQDSPARRTRSAEKKQRQSMEQGTAVNDDETRSPARSTRSAEKRRASTETFYSAANEDETSSVGVVQSPAKSTRSASAEKRRASSETFYSAANEDETSSIRKVDSPARRTRSAEKKRKSLEQSEAVLTSDKSVVDIDNTTAVEQATSPAPKRLRSDSVGPKSSLRKNFHPASSAKKSVAFGSPEYVQFNLTSPVMSLTPAKKFGCDKAEKDQSFELDDTAGQGVMVAHENTDKAGHTPLKRATNRSMDESMDVSMDSISPTAEMDPRLNNSTMSVDSPTEVEVENTVELEASLGTLLQQQTMTYDESLHTGTLETVHEQNSHSLDESMSSKASPAVKLGTVNGDYDHTMQLEADLGSLLQQVHVMEDTADLRQTKVSNRLSFIGFTQDSSIDQTVTLEEKLGDILNQSAGLINTGNRRQSVGVAVHDAEETVELEAGLGDLFNKPMQSVLGTNADESRTENHDFTAMLSHRPFGTSDDVTADITVPFQSPKPPPRSAQSSARRVRRPSMSSRRLTLTPGRRLSLTRKGGVVVNDLHVKMSPALNFDVSPPKKDPLDLRVGEIVKATNLETIPMSGSQDIFEELSQYIKNSGSLFLSREYETIMTDICIELQRNNCATIDFEAVLDVPNDSNSHLLSLQHALRHQTDSNIDKTLQEFVEVALSSTNLEHEIWLLQVADQMMEIFKNVDQNVDELLGQVEEKAKFVSEQNELLSLLETKALQKARRRSLDRRKVSWCMQDV